MSDYKNKKEFDIFQLSYLNINLLKIQKEISEIQNFIDEYNLEQSGMIENSLICLDEVSSYLQDLEKKMKKEFNKKNTNKKDSNIESTGQ